MSNEQRSLLEKLSRGIAYAVPAIAIVVGGSAFHAIASDAVSEDGYQMTAVGEAEAPQAEAAAEAHPAAEAEAAAEAHPAAEAEAAAEAHPEAEAEAEAHPEAEADAGN
ncbi:MAG: hypothetical protein H0T88_05240 [Lysobacter sp.]|nr:hypothetical protein [Lysobacter sp.]